MLILTRLTDDFSLNLSGTLLLKRGELLSVSVFSSGDSDYKIHGQSGFSCHQLTELFGFHAVKAATQYVGGDWTHIMWWYTEGERGLYYVGRGFNAETGTYTAPKHATFYCAAQIHFDLLNSEGSRDIMLTTTLHLRLDDDENNALYSVETKGRPQRYYSLDLAGLVALKAGQVVSLWAYSSISTQINTRSGFSCHSMGTQKGFHGNLRKDFRIPKGRSTLASWHFLFNGRYDSGGRPAGDGLYTAPESGYYVCAAQVRCESVDEHVHYTCRSIPRSY